MSRPVARRRHRTSGIDSSGSWSDVSDCDSASVRAEASPRKPAHNEYSKDRGHTSAIVGKDTVFVNPSDYDLSERLTKSLEIVENGQNYDYEYSDPHSLPLESLDDDWDFMREGSPMTHTRASSFPSSGFFMVQHPDRETNGLETNGHSRNSGIDQDQGEKIKNKLMSAWNNVRHGWTVKMKTNFRYDREVWLLGKLYHNTDQEREDQRKRMDRGITVVTALEKFKRDFTSRFWFTYRQDFPCLPGTQLTSDVGWGCMLRSGQMLLCQALTTHFLGRDWWWYPTQKTQDMLYHYLLIRWFGDHPSDQSPFSIHKLVQYGLKIGKKPGDWYGPASVAHVLKEAVDQASNFYPLLGQLCLYVAQDCTIYKQDVIDLCTQPRRRQSRASQSGASSHDNSSGLEPPWRAVIVLVPVRLGGESFNTYYIPSLQYLLRHELCIGIMGGKPKHSVYFVGWQEDKLIYMDPHFCQDYVDVSKKEFDTHSFHCMSPRKMPFAKLDPSCTIGFYCQTRMDFQQVEKLVMDAHKVVPQTEKGMYPMFVFSEGHGCDVNYQAPTRERYLRVRRVDSHGRPTQPSKASDDFVFL